MKSGQERKIIKKFGYKIKMVDQFQINRRKEFLTPSLHFIQFIRICASSAFIGPTLSDVINKSVAL